MTILSLLLVVLFACVVIWGVRSLLAAFGVGEPISTVVMVFVVILLLVWILGQFGIVSGLGSFRLGK